MKRKIGFASATFALAMVIMGCQHEVEHVHTFSTEWSSDENNHWHDASCVHDEKTNFESHRFSEWKTVDEPTEEEDGLKERICSMCGYKEPETIFALGHHHDLKPEWSFDETSHWHAYDCGRNGHFEDKATHTKNDRTVVKEPTCTEKGTVNYKCNICQYEWSEDIEAKGHSLVNDVCTVCRNYCFHESVQKIDQVLIDGKNFDIVTFGDFPQTIKAESVVVDETKIKTMGYLTYYLGSDSCWYAKKLDMYKASFGSIDYYNDGTTHREYGEFYFKVEPIKWRVLTDEYSGKSLLLSESRLERIHYYESKSVHRNGSYACNYQHSQIRAYLNGISYDAASASDEDKWTNKGFLQTAFTETAIAKIAVTDVDNSVDGLLVSSYMVKDIVCENTMDKIFLLSDKEVTNSEYGFSAWNVKDKARDKKQSDYLIAAGVPYDTWWLRSPGFDYNVYEDLKYKNTYSAHLVYFGGALNFNDGKTLESREFGAEFGYSDSVVPALCVFR